jgi:hypothetical protein
MRYYSEAEGVTDLVEGCVLIRRKAHTTVLMRAHISMNTYTFTRTSIHTRTYIIQGNVNSRTEIHTHTYTHTHTSLTSNNGACN